MEHIFRRIYADPEFHELEQKRGRFSWLLALIIFLAYFSFILIIAFSPEIFAIAIYPGSVITWGIPVGLSVIMLSFLLTGVYVYKANAAFDHLVEDIVQNAKDQIDE